MRMTLHEVVTEQYDSQYFNKVTMYVKMPIIKRCNSMLTQKTKLNARIVIATFRFVHTEEIDSLLHQRH